MATTTPPAACPGCGKPQAGTDYSGHIYLYECGSQFVGRSGKWNAYCEDAWAWAAQHRPLLGELVAALERLLRATEILTLDDNYAQEYDSEVKEWKAADVAARAALAKVAAQD